MSAPTQFLTASTVDGAALLANARGLYMTGIRDGKPEEAMATFIGDSYKQHSTGVAEGKEGFIAFFAGDFLKRAKVRDIQIRKAFFEGNFCFVIAEQNINEGQSRWVTADFFRGDANNQIVEHWDVIAEFEGKLPNGRTQVDGSPDVLDLDKTESNKTLVKDMITNLLKEGGDTSNVAKYIAEEYLQHNRGVEDGRAAFEKLIQSDKKRVVQNVHQLIGQGNFVATLSLVTVEKEEFAQADLYRLENDKIVEHWEVSEPIPQGPQPNSGKF